MAAGTLVEGGIGSQKPSEAASKEASKVEDEATEKEITDPGIPRMTPAMLRKFCKESKGYEAPELNEVLSLHYKGFRKIEGLSAYCNVRSLFLECNGIARIENLEGMTMLTSLYLQSNCIRRIEGLDKLVHLMYLNLSNNSISEVENLSECRKLETLKLSANKITEVSSLAGLACRPNLKDVDISCNYIEDGEALLDFWCQTLPDIECVYIHHNPCSRSLRDSRRRLVSSLPKLRWVDDRPVTGLERAGCEAWATGGKDAELLAKQAYWQKEKEDKTKSFYAFRQVQEAHASKTQAQREAEATREAERAKAAAELQATGVLAEGFVSVPVRPQAAPAEAQDGPKDTSSRAEMRAKVDALLASRRRKEVAQEEAAQPSGAREPEEVHANAEDTKEIEAPLPSAEQADVPFEWSGFRDRRLGRLVADFRYNFKKAAAALSEEFQSTVSEAECRSRYGTLCRPTKKTEGASAPTVKDIRAEASRAAKDGPAPTAAAVDEVSKWWVRKIARGPVEGEGASLKTSTPAASASEAALPTEDGILADLSELPEQVPVRRSEAVPGPWDGIAGVASMGSSGLFAPPPRSAAPAEPEEVKTIEAPRPAKQSAGKAQAPDLYELD